MIINIKKLSDDAVIPTYGTHLSAGCDISSIIDTVVDPLSRLLVPTGLAISLSPGYEAQIRPRSGLALNYGMTVLNTPGTIDADYRGEIKIILLNTSLEPFTIRKGMKIAQMVIAPVIQVSWNEVSSLDNTQRQDKGFGSTGV
jgi:dUTP pyrophosphatase